jgi:hypothetical protein
MRFSIGIEGLDEAMKNISRMAHGLTVQGVNEECNKIKQAAKKCGLNPDSVTLEAVPNGKELK